MERTLPVGTVTLLFTDIEGSTRLLQTLGDGYGAALAEHRQLLRDTWADHDGAEVDTEGDTFFVAFARADRAVAAAVEAQRRLAAHTWPGGVPLRVRIGVHTGTPHQQDGGYWGEDVHYAARLAAAGHGGQVLLSATTRALAAEQPAESLGEHALRDFPAPREIFHLVIDGRAADAFPPPRTAERIRSNVPPRSGEILGRAADVAQLRHRVQTEPLVTVAGPGGVGKTRLLIELGHELADDVDQVLFVFAEQLTSVAGVLGAIVRAFGLVEERGVDDLERLVAYASRRRLLLLVDNVEQVPGVGPALARIAAAGPQVRVVVTSQVPLHVPAERVQRLAPLSTPGQEQCAGPVDPAQVLRNPSVALLVRRAAAIGSSFRLDEHNAADVARLCTLLDGMPLALELAAARLDLLSPAALCQRLDNGLDGLGKGGRELPPRQRGLRAVLEWTCGLLTCDERALLARLSVFAGGFTTELVEAAFGDCLDELAALVDVSLVYRTTTGRLIARPPVRRFACELLETEHDPQQAFAALCDAVTALAEPLAILGFADPDVVPRRRRLNAETENVFVALDWAVEHDPHRHARLVTAAAWWMSHANFSHVGRRHLELALSRTDDPSMRARCLHGLGWLGLELADGDAGLLAARAWHGLGDVVGEVMALGYAANMCAHGAAYERSLEIVEQAFAVLDAGHHAEPNLRWFLDMMHAQAISGLGLTDEARAQMQPYLDAAAPMSWRHGFIATILADVALTSGRNADALPLYGVALKVFGEIGESRSGAVIQTDSITVALARLDRVEEAALCLGLCELGHDELGWAPRGNLATDLEAARALLTDEQMTAGRCRARELGTTVGLRWVGMLARGEVTGVASAPRTGATPATVPSSPPQSVPAP